MIGFAISVCEHMYVIGFAISVCEHMYVIGFIHCVSENVTVVVIAIVVTRDHPISNDFKIETLLSQLLSQSVDL